jgi:hypothetical protein
MSGVGTAIAIGAGVSAAGAIGGAAISSSAAGNAASTQANAADEAAQLQAQEAQNSLNFEEQEFNTQQSNIAPWLTAGKAGLTNLQTLLGIGSNTNAPGYGSLLTPFTPPTLSTAEQYPGYEFQLQQGEGALENSTAAKGSLVSGNDLEAEQQYGQNLAQNDYTNAYNQSFNTFETNQTNTYNRLAALSGIGQTAATTLGTEGQNAANTVANIDLTTGAQQGQDIQNAAAAEASGYVGSANAWSGALGGGTNNLTNLMLLSQLYGQNGSGSGFGTQASFDFPPGVTYGDYNNPSVWSAGG